jgi:tetratricopeptide (TPR) repeat protein
MVDPVPRWTMPLSSLFLALLLAFVFGTGCRADERSRLSSTETLAELRSVKGALKVMAPGEAPRTPYRRERLIDGQKVSVPAGGLAWMRRDGGATWLVAGPAEITLKRTSVELWKGRAFVDSELGEPVAIVTPRGALELSEVRASVEIDERGDVSVYVLRGSARAGSGARANAGEILSWTKATGVRRSPAVAWEDWTGGFATADPSLDPAPFGIGTVGARKPGDAGKPRTSLVIQRLDVKVEIEQDFAVTEVDETFVNPTGDVVEGIFSFRTPQGAVLERFGVDRDGDLVWGRVKESVAAAEQYQQNVYEGSEEDPALLQWAGAGTYSARLYPIGPGKSRRVVTRYSEWLPRQGPRAERRLYVYPMAAEGAKASLPRIEELTVTLDLTRAGARAVRAGMGGRRDGHNLVIKAFDFVPRADLAVELFDDGQAGAVAYRARHVLSERDVPDSAAPGFANEVARSEADYVAIPLRAPSKLIEGKGGIDLAIVIDASAATEPSALAIARAMAASLLLHLGPEDRAALWAGDATLHSVAEGSGALGRVDRATRKRWLSGLAAVERGGATDIGALLTEAASRLDPTRRGAVIYVGDGAPSVGELAPKALRDRLSRLSPNTRVLVAAVGSQPNSALLETLARGAPVEHVDDGYGAARAALRLLEAAGRPIWMGAKLDLGPGVERVLPRELPPIASDETVLVVGRVSGQLPKELALKGSAGVAKERLSVRWLDDGGDLRRRWGEQRLAELGAEGAGRASLVETARRFGLVSPFTSLYVPTRRENVAEPPDDRQVMDRLQRLRRWKPWSFGVDRSGHHPIVLSSSVLHSQGLSRSANEKEGGTGMRELTPAAADVPMEATTASAPMSGAKGEVPMGALEHMPMSAPPVTPLKPGATGTGLSAVGDLPNSAPAAGKTRRPMKELSAAPRPVGAGRARRAPLRPLGIDPLQETEPEPKRGPPPEAKENSTKPPPATEGVSERQVLAKIEHQPSPCGKAADLPFNERLVLWRERLRASPSIGYLLSVYRGALTDCEASEWRERVALLVVLVDRLSSIRERVELWRALIAVSPRAADAVYRFLLLRVQTSAELKEFHDALGFRRIEPELLASYLKQAKTPLERVTLLRAAAERFADDTELALLVLEAYEDAGDAAGGRAWARRLRRRVDATAHVRTNVGEYYLRLAASQGGADGAHDSAEALRTFGELVEFAPEDPLTRRLLGDLLRAHGWYEQALRQYQTLATLTPDDASVPLLLALAAQGTGKVEEAVRWAEKAAQGGSPDGASPVPLAARALASAFLAWARQESANAGKVAEVERLRHRAQRLASSEAGRGVRVVLSWAHPELRPVLWTDSLGSMLPADHNLPLLGVGQAFVPVNSPTRIEVRLDPEDAARAARLGAVATLTVIEAEGGGDERIERRDIRFRDAAGKPLDRVELRFERGVLREGAL